MNVPKADRDALLRDKYEGKADPAAFEADIRRLACGEPPAYVIGWLPFLGLRIGLGSKPLIPRPETEYWTEQLIARLKERFGTTTRFRFLDLCAGSGAIGLAVLKEFPAALVYFGELAPQHAGTIHANIHANSLDESRADVRAGDLFAPFAAPEPVRFDVIAANPPYIPRERALPESVARHEPSEALYSGADGLDLIRRIASGAPAHLAAEGELWLECDISNIEEAQKLLLAAGFVAAAVHTDQYGRPRYVVSH